ncbi:shTK domain protein [Oesophagostomum dentatum]|uniref:ShTK domain protein n=1 Tax=Oesophagostomum dentatum TaxID=61180 RepID=A0A0B1RUN7_OESDE|nr:shTK domain protein [Oesophagostomum dentatum]
MFQSENVANEEVKQAIIKVCPKTCGYCCLTDAFNCDNKPFPRISCSAITQTMCQNEIWRPIITEDCPKICGFCEASE